MSAFALSGARVFDGTMLREGVAVLVDGSRIAAVVDARDVPADVAVQRVEGLLTPGFIDVQVNGGGGVLFNDDRTVDGIAAIGRAHRRYGTTGFLPTFITDTRERMAEAVAAADDAIAAGVAGVLGMHVEGPFFNPERKGVHREDYIRAIEEPDIALLTRPGRGKRLVTLAPERVPLAAITRLAGGGCIVAAGHTAGAYEEIMAARAAGVTGFTHLFNAMPPLAGRAPGPVGAALDDREAWVSLIVDAIHVAVPSLRIAIAARGWERMVLVTDAMPSVGTDLRSFVLQGRTINRTNGRLTIAGETGDVLAGSDLDMASAVRNTVNTVGLPLEAALHMASRAPAEFIGLGGELGRIAPGYRASLVLLDDALNVRATWIDGRAD